MVLRQFRPSERIILGGKISARRLKGNAISTKAAHDVLVAGRRANDGQRFSRTRVDEVP